MTILVSPPQLRMVCLSSAATNMQQVPPYKEKKQDFFHFAIHHVLLVMTQESCVRLYFLPQSCLS